MIRFLFKGLLRDRSRSLFPMLVVVMGVFLTVVMQCWLAGAMQDMIHAAASYDAGHLKVMSRAYAAESDQVPNDLAYIGVDSLVRELSVRHPSLLWTPRIKFGGLLDIPDENGETRSQGMVAGLAVDLFSPDSPERDVLNLQSAIVRGRLPERPGEIVISDDFAASLDVEVGQTATLISSTMYGSIAAANYTVVGTIRFGVTVMDRGAMIADVSDIQYCLDMQDAAGEILGFYKTDMYVEEEADSTVAAFNASMVDNGDEYAPEMVALHQQSGLGERLDLMESMSVSVLVAFILVMSIVLWNSGLMGSIRRYGEIGVRLAIGEDKGHLYRSMIAESLMIGVIGTIVGTALGLVLAYYLQVEGVDISSMMKNASVMIPDKMHGQITASAFVIGFVPGVAATFLGTCISGVGIYRRQTAHLVKELEA